MFRMTQFLQEIVTPTPLGPRRNPPGPVVIWNLIRRCNLTCKHCYSISADIDFPDELSTADIFTVMDDLKTFRVPALILSGGEPLLRPDIFDIATRAKQLGFYVGLSSNGTLINETNIDQIVATGFDYVGVSLDGMGATHDKFRRKKGAFAASMHGINLCRNNGIRVGLRFTMTQDNCHELGKMLDLLDSEDIDKFYFSHLNYAGRGHRNRKDDTIHRQTRDAMDMLLERCWSLISQRRPKEIVTGNNDADGAWLLKWIEHNFPAHAEHIRGKLVQWGGNASGVNVANIDNTGVVHPDTMWWHYPLGNVRQRPFSAIWQDLSDPVMAGLKQHPRPVKGRCGECQYLDICNGNTRVRAMQTRGDVWAEDPACYLDDEDIYAKTLHYHHLRTARPANPG